MTASFTEKYYGILKNGLDSIEVTTPGAGRIDFQTGIELAADSLLKARQNDRRLFFIGNGASAAISSHAAADYLKNGRMSAYAFSDPALLTCVGNDLGFENLYAEPLSRCGHPGDTLVAISSSGQSPNILNGVRAAREKGLTVITLSGFKPDNPLRLRGDINFYVPLPTYGHVEIIHHSICHCILDYIIASGA